MAKQLDANDPETILAAGAVMNPLAASEAGNLVVAADFYDKRLGRVWEAVLKLLANGAEPNSIDALVVAGAVAESATARTQFGIFCVELSTLFPRQPSLKYHANLVRRRATLRLAAQRLKDINAELEDQIAEPQGDVGTLEERLGGLTIELAKRSDVATGKTTYEDSSKEITTYFDDLRVGKEYGIPTGIYDLDKRLGGGIRAGQLYVVAGQTGSGKTAFASQVSDYAVLNDKRVLMFSMELDPIDIFIRDAERVSQVSRWDLKGHDGDAARLKLLEAGELNLLNRFKAGKGKIVFGQPMSVQQIRHAVLTEKMRGGRVDMIVVDHAQVALGAGGQKKNQPRYLEVKDIAVDLRLLAIQQKIAVLLTAQLNPSEAGVQPSMALLRESKDLANSADVVLLIWHQRLILDESKEDAHTPEDTIQTVKSWIVVEKIRAGMTGKLQVRYVGKHFRFESLDTHHS